MNTGLCECGCGLPTPLARDNNATMGYRKGEPMRFRKGHRMANGKYRVMRAGAGVKAVHLVIAERALGHGLPAGSEVHHVDLDSRNNSPSNLVICQDGNFHKLLHARTRVVMAGGDPNTQRVCDHCRQVKAFTAFAKSRRQGSGLQSRCKTCSAETSRCRRAANAA